MPIKPHIRILKDGWPEANAMYWAGFFPRYGYGAPEQSGSGYSIIGPVARMTLAQAIHFYFRALGIYPPK